MKKTKNNYICTTKAPHFCKYCKELIKPNSKVRTVNPKIGSRYWICNTCSSQINKILSTKMEMNNVSFGDEGGYLALSDFLDEVFEQFAERCKDDEYIESFRKTVYPHQEEYYL